MILIAIAPSGIPDAGDQLPRAEGFRNIVVSAQVEPGDNAGLIAGGGKEDYRNIAIRFYGTAYRIAVAVLQGNIDQSEIEAGER